MTYFAYPERMPSSPATATTSGSIALGALLGWAASRTVQAGLLAWAGTGFLGAITTFSTFTYETLRLLEDGAWRYAALNLLASGPISFAGALVAFLAVR